MVHGLQAALQRQRRGPVMLSCQMDIVQTHKARAPVKEQCAPGSHATVTACASGTDLNQVPKTNGCTIAGQPWFSCQPCCSPGTRRASLCRAAQAQEFQESSGCARTWLLIPSVIVPSAATPRSVARDLAWHSAGVPPATAGFLRHVLKESEEPRWQAAGWPFCQLVVGNLACRALEPDACSHLPTQLLAASHAETAAASCCQVRLEPRPLP